MVEGSSDATALLGMDGFVVLVMERIEGEWWLLVETTATVAGCPDCGVRAIGHGRGTVQVRDLPNGSGAVRLVWRKRRWKCPDPDCERRTFTERSELVEGSLTWRARAEICRAVGEGGHTVAEQARRFGIGWSTAMSAVSDHGRPLVEDDRRLHRVHTLGVDEHKMLAAGPRHHTVFATQLVDLDRGRLLDVVPGRSAKSVSGWLDQRTRYWRDHVDVVAIDPHRGYHNALVSRLPRATVTIDHFHAIKLANVAIDDVRRRVQRETLGHRGRKDDPLYGARRLMTRGWERLPDHQVARLMEALRQGDIFDEVGAAITGEGAPARVLRVEDPGDRPTETRSLLRTRHIRSGEGGLTPRPNGQALGVRDHDLLRDPRVERWQRGDEPDHREAPPQRPRVQELRELPAPAVAPLGCQMEHSLNCSNQGPSPTPRRVEPAKGFK